MLQLMANEIVFAIPGMEQVEHKSDLIYKTADQQSLLLDVYLPAPSEHPPPVVILIHGGMPPGMKAKNHGHFVSWAQAIAASGMCAVMFNHRTRWIGAYVPESLPQAAEDLADAAGFVREHAARFKIDANRICLLAFSAGGPLLAAPLRERWDSVRCIVAFYAILGEPIPGSAEAGRFSALAGLSDSKTPPPTFIAKAGKDTPALNESIDQFTQAARDLGGELRLEVHPAGVHAFDALNDDDTSRRIVRDAIEFARIHLSQR